MKQKDIALFIVIAFLSTIVAVVVSNFFITPASGKTQQAEVVGAISSELTPVTADNKYFNKDAINPTKLIEIGGDPNQKPFSGGAN